MATAAGGAWVGDHGIDRAPAALFATTAFANAADVPAAAADTTIVLVHGAFADGASWDKVIPLLHAKGYKVVAVQNPLSSLADDVAATRRVVDAQTGKVVLVGRSWGCTVIAEAGTSDKIKALVYVAAFAASRNCSRRSPKKSTQSPPRCRPATCRWCRNRPRWRT